MRTKLKEGQTMRVLAFAVGLLLIACTALSVIAALFPTTGSGFSPSPVLKTRGYDLLKAEGLFGYGHPVWSPDGNRIAYARARSSGGYLEPQTSEIFIVNTITKQTVQLTFNQDEDISPSWSPDAFQIVYVRAVSADNGSFERYSLRAVDSDGQHDRDLYLCPTICDYPAWSPDGQSIVFSMKVNESYDLFLLKLKDMHSTQITVGINATNPRWSPDGKQIAFSASNDVYSLDINNKHITMISPEGFSANTYPSWSPDGKRIVFVSNGHAGNRLSEIYVMKPDGTQVSPLFTSLLEGVTQPDWSPNAQFMIIVTLDQAQIYIADLGIVGQETVTPTTH